MSDLPVRKMVLYKHGVGFFQREGEVEGQQAELTFRQDAINDILKSLAVFDRSGGQVMGIHYQTPMDRDKRLEDSSIRLSDAASLLDMLRDLRGREVTLTLRENEVTGKVIGIDNLPSATGVTSKSSEAVVISFVEAKDSVLVSILESATKQVHVYPLADVRSVKILDQRAEHDLSYFLETSLSDEVRLNVTLQLSEGTHDLVLYYVAPSPTWRVSYRVVADSDDSGSGGTALIQAWGLFDNRLDEDLEDVHVTLVAGQPISFIYDLYTSFIPERKVVKDQPRVAPGPIQYQAQERARGPRLKAIDSGRLGEAAPASVTASGYFTAPDTGNYVMSRSESLRQSAQSAATGEEVGEFFQYEITTSVTVKRGESALVPIISTDVKYERELLYNRAKLPDHPVAALRFENSTNLTLEEGPVTLVEDDDYKGEAVIPFTRADNDVYLAYAVELGVKVTELLKTVATMAHLHFHEGNFIVQEYHTTTTTFTLENTTGRDLVITVEANKKLHHELVDTPDPDSETASEQRWKIPVSAHSTEEFTRSERRMNRRISEIRQMTYKQLQEFFEQNWLDKHAYESLSSILRGFEQIQQANEELTQVDPRREEIYKRQTQLRENLIAMGTQGEEGQFRSRLLHQLESSEDQLLELDTRQTELEQFINDTEAAVEEMIQAVSAAKG